MTHDRLGWQPVNPVERRLMLAHRDWLTFAQDASARLMVWRTDSADAPLVRLYFQAQAEMSCAVIVLRSACDDGVHYPYALAQEVIDFYESRRAASAAQGLRADWHPPANAGRDGALYLLQVVDSLMRHHPDLFPGMVLVLEPQPTGHRHGDAAFERAAGDLLTAAALAPQLSERLRFVVPRVGDSPMPSLSARFADIVRVVQGRYAMASVPRELLAESGERGPSAELRRLFVELGETVGEDDPAKTMQLHARALEIAQREQWPDQCVVLHLIAGAAWLKQRHHENALAAYRNASECGRQALSAGHDAGHQLVANGLFGEASVHLVRGEFAHAACCYERAASEMDAARDALMTVEAWRMCADCWDKAGERKFALEAGFNALDAGLGIDAQMRRTGSLPLVVEWMARRVDAFDKRRAELHEKVDALLNAQRV